MRRRLPAGTVFDQPSQQRGRKEAGCLPYCERYPDPPMLLKTSVPTLATLFSCSARSIGIRKVIRTRLERMPLQLKPFRVTEVPCHDRTLVEAVAYRWLIEGKARRLGRCCEPPVSSQAEHWLRPGVR